MNNIHKLFSEKTRTVCLLDGNSKNGNHCTHGPTYSMAGVIGTTAWQKGFICRCHYLCCHSQWKSIVTCPYLSTGCGLRFSCAQSHSDNGHVHATAPRSAHALTQAHPTMSCYQDVQVNHTGVHARPFLGGWCSTTWIVWCTTWIQLCTTWLGTRTLFFFLSLLFYSCILNLHTYCSEHPLLLFSNFLGTCLPVDNLDNL